MSNSISYDNNFTLGRLNRYGSISPAYRRIAATIAAASTTTAISNPG